MRLTELLTMHGIPFRRSQYSADEIRICCPFCSSRGQSADTRFRLGINLSSNKAGCFNCSWVSRHALSAITRHLRFFGDLESEEGGIEYKPEKVRLPEDFHFINWAGDDFDKMAAAYVHKRGITKQQVASKHIGTSFVGRYAFRIIFPVYVQGKLSGIVARSFAGKEPRYLNSPGLKSLYNLPRRKVEEVILLEGVIKALRVEQIISHTSAAASLLGHSITSEQIDQLKQSGCKKITVFPDPDPVGQRGAVRVAEEIDDKLHIRPNVILNVVQPADELSLNALRHVLAHGVPIGYHVRESMLARTLLQ